MSIIVVTFAWIDQRRIPVNHSNPWVTHGTCRKVTNHKEGGSGRFRQMSFTHGNSPSLTVGCSEGSAAIEMTSQPSWWTTLCQDGMEGSLYDLHLGISLAVMNNSQDRTGEAHLPGASDSCVRHWVGQASFPAD